jgi:hypothetical protein
MEAGLAVELVLAGVAGAFLVWLAIDKASETGRDKEIWAVLSGAATAYLGSLVLKPEGDRWNPVKDRIKADFEGKFTARRNKGEMDADDAVILESFSPQEHPKHSKSVNGWGWDARRLRTRYIQDHLVRS